MVSTSNTFSNLYVLSLFVFATTSLMAPNLISLNFIVPMDRLISLSVSKSANSRLDSDEILDVNVDRAIMVLMAVDSVLEVYLLRS
jgi:hypothetical protein